MTDQLSLRKIDESNFITCFNLELGPGQERFVSHPIRSLAQAYVYYSHCTPFAIYWGDVMVSSVTVSDVEDVPACLSSKLVTDVLRNELKWNGVVITDELSGDAFKNITQGDAAVEAIQAGADMLSLFARFSSRLVLPCWLRLPLPEYNASTDIGTTARNGRR